MGRKQGNGSSKNKTDSKVIRTYEETIAYCNKVNEDALKHFNEVCSKIGHRISEVTYPEPSSWICYDEPITYIYDPKLREYVSYIRGKGIFEFNNLQEYSLAPNKIDSSRYVENLIRTATKVKNLEITPQEAIKEFDKKYNHVDKEILI